MASCYSVALEATSVGTRRALAITSLLLFFERNFVSPWKKIPSMSSETNAERIIPTLTHFSFPPWSLNWKFRRPTGPKILFFNILMFDSVRMAGWMAAGLFLLLWLAKWLVIFLVPPLSLLFLFHKSFDQMLLLSAIFPFPPLPLHWLWLWGLSLLFFSVCVCNVKEGNRTTLLL